MVAHMGVSGIEPHNSIPAYIAAGNRSYFGVETDLRVTADGNFIVIHDVNTRKLTGEDHVVAETPYEVLRGLRLIDPKMPELSGNPSLVLPSLEEYIYVCKKYGKKCVLELKGAFNHENLVNLVNRVRRTGYQENVIYISFDLDQLIDLREQQHFQTMQYLCWDYTPEMLEAMDKYNLDLNANIRRLSKEQIDEVHAHGHKVNCWVCDTVEVAEMLVNMGVDYITTNILE